MGFWGCLMVGVIVVIYVVGWFEGGLMVFYEKLVIDVEVLNMVVEFCVGKIVMVDEIGFYNVLFEVDLLGYFFVFS